MPLDVFKDRGKGRLGRLETAVRHLRILPGGDVEPDVTITDEGITLRLSEELRARLFPDEADADEVEFALVPLPPLTGRYYLNSADAHISWIEARQCDEEDATPTPTEG